MCGRLFEVAKKNVATFAVKNPHLGNQHNDLMNYFYIPMNQHTFAKFVSVYLNMHPSVRETLIRTCGSTLEQEYEKIHRYMGNPSLFKESWHLQK